MKITEDTVRKFLRNYLEHNLDCSDITFEYEENEDCELTDEQDTDFSRHFEVVRDKILKGLDL